MQRLRTPLCVLEWIPEAGDRGWDDVLPKGWGKSWEILWDFWGFLGILGDFGGLVCRGHWDSEVYGTYCSVASDALIAGGSARRLLSSV